MDKPERCDKSPSKAGHLKIQSRIEASLYTTVEEVPFRQGAFLLNSLAEKEDAVYPMIPAGNALVEMVRRPHGGTMKKAGA